MSVQIQLRRDIAAQWTSVNPTLAEGEVGIETDTGKVKIGSGLSAWTSLPYFGGGGAGSVTSANFVSLRSAVTANSAQMTSADNALSAAVNVVSNAASNALSVANATSAALAALSAQHTSLAGSVAGALSAIAANSAQMTSADNAISAAVNVVSNAASNALSVANAASNAVSVLSVQLSLQVSALSQVHSALSANVATISLNVSALSTRLSALSSQVSSNSAQMTSADNAISAAVNVVSNAASNALSVANAVSNRLSTWTLDNLANVSAPSPTTGQVLAFNSVAGQWVASTMGGPGGGSVTSTELSAVSAAAASADATLSVRIDSAMTVVSNQGSAIVANSAQMTSADNAISAAAAAVSVRVDSVMTVVSNQGSAIVANSAQMTSAINVVSNTLSDLRSDHIVLSDKVSAISAQMTSADNAISAAVASVAAVVSSWATSGNALALPIKRTLAGNQLVSATAPVSLSGFTFTVSANTAYMMDFLIFCSSPISLAAPKFIISAPGTPTRFLAEYQNFGAPGNATSVVAAANATVAYTTVSATGATRPVRIRGGVFISANGTIALAVGNAVSGGAAGSSITFLAGSYGMVWKMS